MTATVLLIDDDPGVQRSIVRALADNDMEVVTARNGAAGIAAVTAAPDRFSVVVSEAALPDIDGILALERIAAINPGITRLLLSTYRGSDAAIAGANAHIDGFLPKPLNPAILTAKMRQVRIRKLLMSRLSHHHYQNILHSDERLAPAKGCYSVACVGLRNLDPLVAHLTPAAAADFMTTHFFVPLGEIAAKFQSVVYQHLGAGLTAVFGVPQPDPEDAVRAVDAAVLMQAAVLDLNTTLERSAQPTLEVGIGIATGSATAAVSGTRREKTYHFFGPVVATAVDLQRMARMGDILVCQNTRRGLQGRASSNALSFDPLPPTLAPMLRQPQKAYAVRLRLAKFPTETTVKPRTKSSKTTTAAR